MLEVLVIMGSICCLAARRGDSLYPYGKYSLLLTNP